MSGQAQTGNYYFEANPDLATYPQAARIRAALGLATAPVLWLAGHIHWNSVTQVDGVFHLTQQSLTESFTTGGAPALAWGTLDLGEEAAWTVYGADPIACVLPVRRARWTPPLARFRERPLSDARAGITDHRVETPGTGDAS